MVNVNCHHNASLFILIPVYLPQCTGVCAWWGVDVSITGHYTLYHFYHGALVTPDSGHLLSDGPLIYHGIVLAPL